jgi:hypothetical protein
VTVPRAAIAAIARAEVARRWRALVVIGVLAGFVGGAVVGAISLARRTGTAHARLEHAVHLEDARVTIFGDQSLADDVVRLPGVRDAWVATQMVAKLQGPGVVYVGITSGASPHPDLYTPIVVEGRAADPAAVDEAVLLESTPVSQVAGVGDEIPLKMLLPEEVRSFDTGFGEPDGPSFTLHVTGIVRVAGDLGGSPILTTPAFAEEYDEFTAGRTVFVRLEDRPGAREEFLAGAERLEDTAASIEGGEEFEPIVVSESFRNERQVIATSRVLVGGLAVFAAVVGVVGLIGLAQVVGRHQSAGVAQQRVEAALGLTASERALARAVPALLAAGIAAVVTFAIALVAGVLEPSGVMRRVEPNPGWAPNVAIAAIGALVAGLVTVSACALAARRVLGDRPSDADAPSRSVRIARAVTARPSVVAGLAFAFGTGRSARASASRFSLAGVVIGIAGLVGALTFGASLDRLAATPSRYGWNADFSVVDVDDEIVDELLADTRLDAVTYVESKSIVVDGLSMQAYAHRDRRGHTGWTLVDGRAPASPGEIALTAQTARRLGRGIGDTVGAVDTRGAPVALTIVGLGIGPNNSNERLDELALVTSDDIARLGVSQAFTEALVSVAPGVDVGDVIASYADRYELTEPSMPADVANIAELGSLPEALGAFLAVIAVVALLHLLATTVSRRADDLAVLRALGATRTEIRRVVVVAAVSVALVGLVAGVPLGLALGRLVWWSVAHSIGVASDASYLAGPFAVIVPVVLAASVVVAWIPTRRAMRLSVRAVE